MDCLRLYIDPADFVKRLNKQCGCERYLDAVITNTKVNPIGGSDGSLEFTVVLCRNPNETSTDNELDPERRQRYGMLAEDYVD